MNKIRLVILLAVLLILGIALTISGISNIIKLNGTIPDFNFDSLQNIKSGDFVQGYVGNILDCYASETTTNTTMGIETSSHTSEEYFIMPLINDADAEKELYITITASKQNDRDLLYKICDETYESYMGNTVENWTEFGIVAKVKKIDPELDGFLTEWFQEVQWFDEDETHHASVSEIKQHILPFELVVYNTNGAYTGLIVGLVIIAAFAVVGTIVYKKLRPGRETEPAYTSPAPGAAEESGGFSESFAPAEPQPIQNIPQPVQPDEFFTRPERPARPVPEPQPEPEKSPAPVTADVGNMDSLDTSALNTDGLAEEYEFTDESEQ